MATSPNHCGTYDYNCKVSVRLAGSASGRTNRESHDMEVKGPTITAMGLGAPDLQGGQSSKARAERLSELQERRRSLQTLLNARLGELRRVCLLEAELTGELPKEFPLETGERPPQVRRRGGLAHHGSKHSSKGEEEETCQRKQKKALFSGALRRQTDSEQHPPHGKRTVHRGCHTDDTVKSESSSMSDSTGQDNDESSPGPAPDGLSPSRPRLAPGSPDSRICRKLSPVEIYYEMRTRRNSMASSASPSRSLPRSVSNVEGRSVPATPLLSRTVPTSVHVRSEVSGGKHWSDSPDVPQVVPLQSQEGSSSGSFERGGCPYSARTRRSNSSEALLDRTVFPEEAGPRTGMPSRGGPYKSSEALTEGRLRQVHRGSPERHLNGHADQGRMRSSVASPHFNGFPPAQAPHFAPGPPPYSPLLLRGKPGEPRRVKVTRTKSCGPFIPLQQHQQEAILLSAYSEAPHPAPGSAGSSTAALLHKALALEGLRDWYLRNTLGHAAASAATAGKPEPGYSQLPQSATFHGHPLQGRSLELSLYQEPFPSQMQDLTLKEPSTDIPAPGTLV
ncbi:hypothetical protein MATL_G00111380 [Megalops atlanticus]|uniref:Cytohesin Ubiquitin Protein Inducing domain-containing protein n=1 Tax=Megalops atlanticus TaxID=7932 RepID=A0A9D3PZV0_MEGAT|nr:hypothetical protein MATL_G00111380 [Megalops atlanticus]